MRNRIMITGTLVAGLLLSACSGTPPTPKAAAAETFVYANNLPVVSDWDPATSYGSELIAMSNIYERLTRYNSDRKAAEPDLATSWETSKDGLTWTFTLRSDVKFSTGSPMDAAAAKAAIDRTRKLGQGAAYVWAPIKSIDAASPTSLVFKLKYAAPLDLIASAAYGTYIYDTQATSDDLSAWFSKGNTAGTGPYVVQDWNKGQTDELTLAANKSYWGGWTGPHYSEVDFQNVPQETTAAQMVQTGGADFVPRLSPSLFASLSKDDQVTTVSGSSFMNILAMLNTASGPLADVKLRRAVAEAIDYDGIVAALKGSVVKAQGVIPNGLLGYTEDVNQETDGAEAKALLAERGYSPSHPLELTLTYASGTPELETIVTLMKSNLAGVGIDLQTKGVAWETQWDRGKSKDPSERQDIFMLYWFPDYADPFSWFISLYRSSDVVSFNLSYWDSPEADEMIDGLQKLTATDHDAADAQYVTLQQLIAAQSVSPVVGVSQTQRALSSSVTGYSDNPAYSSVVFVHDVAPAS